MSSSTAVIPRDSLSSDYARCLEVGGGRAGGRCRSAASDEQQQPRQQQRGEGVTEDEEAEAADAEAAEAAAAVAAISDGAPSALDYTAAFSEDDGDLDFRPEAESQLRWPLGSMNSGDEEEFASALNEVLRPVGEGEHEAADATSSSALASPAAAAEAEEEAAAAAAAALMDGAYIIGTAAAVMGEASAEGETEAEAAAALSEMEKALRVVSAAIVEEGDDKGEEGEDKGEGGRRKSFAEWAQRLSRTTRERSGSQVRSATEALRLFYQALPRRP
jgi:hypothetical protein